MTTDTWFIDDDETETIAKNTLLSAHMAGAWVDLDIIRIDRIEDSMNGWQATYQVTE